MQSEKQPSPAEVPRWSLITRVAFRFVFLYFLLYNLPFPFGWVPHTEAVAENYKLLWHKIVPLVGRHILNLSYPITVFTNGSGDTTYDYVLVLCFLILTIIGTVVWSVLDRRKKTYPKLDVWFRLGLRLLLAATLMLFGSVKVFPVQFPEPSLSRLLETYGDSSPLGLLFTFMGTSRAYSAFTGVVEMLAGALLIVPHLATLGALLSIAAMTNVFVLNMAYDVPVKLYSLHVLLMSVLLVVPDAPRLWGILVLNRPAQPCVNAPLFSRNSLNQKALVFQIIFGLSFALNSLYQAHRVDGHLEPVGALYGVWSVEEFTVNSTTRPAITDGDERWRRVVFDRSGNASVQSMDGKLEGFRLEPGENDGKVKLLKLDGLTWSAEFRLGRPSPDLLVLEGRINQENIRARLHRADPEFLLEKRGFHWITEYPFNR